jgi:hypothetical protein
MTVQRASWDAADDSATADLSGQTLAIVKQKIEPIRLLIPLPRMEPTRVMTRWNRQ